MAIEARAAPDESLAVLLGAGRGIPVQFRRVSSGSAVAPVSPAQSSTIRRHAIPGRFAVVTFGLNSRGALEPSRPADCGKVAVTAEFVA
jgi:hypothetical protein